MCRGSPDPNKIAIEVPLTVQILPKTKICIVRPAVDGKCFEGLSLSQQERRAEEARD